jgi:micrococcal nuclease
MYRRLLSQLYGFFAGLGVGFLLLLMALGAAPQWRAALALRLAPATTPQAVAPPAGSEIARVVSVIDGDTIIIESGERVRYLGVDTPETVNPNTPPQFYGREATERNRELVEDQTVMLLRDVEDRDRYGRLLRHVFVGNTWVNAELVRYGFGFATFVPPNSSYHGYLTLLEQQAKTERLGVWSEFPILSTPNPAGGQP